MAAIFAASAGGDVAAAAPPAVAAGMRATCAVGALLALLAIAIGSAVKPGGRFRDLRPADARP